MVGDQDPDRDLSSSSDDEDYVPSEVDDQEDADEAEDLPQGEEGDDLSDEPSDILQKNGVSETGKNGHHSEKQENEEEKRKRADALFEAFLADDEEPSTSYTSASTDLHKRIVEEKNPVSRAKEQDEKKQLSRNPLDDIFDIEPEEKKISEDPESKIKEKDAEPPSSTDTSRNLKRPAVGLDSALSLFSKKSKTTVLSKSENDWKDFKDREGIDEELSTHNRGKKGYIERMEFLARADLRQFANERDARAATRNKKL